LFDSGIQIRALAITLPVAGEQCHKVIKKEIPSVYLPLFQMMKE
jgi:hypothetical protein